MNSFPYTTALVSALRPQLALVPQLGIPSYLPCDVQEHAALVARYLQGDVAVSGSLSPGKAQWAIDEWMGTSDAMALTDTTLAVLSCALLEVFLALPETTRDSPTIYRAVCSICRVLGKAPNDAQQALRGVLDAVLKNSSELRLTTDEYIECEMTLLAVFGLCGEQRLDLEDDLERKLAEAVDKRAQLETCERKEILQVMSLLLGIEQLPGPLQTRLKRLRNRADDQGKEAHGAADASASVQ